MSNQTSNEKKKPDLATVLQWCVFGVVALGWIVFYLLRAEKLLDADMSSEMVLSDLLAKEHRIITPNWKYSTEIRVLNNQIFFSLFLALTGSFKASRLISGVVLLGLYGASYYYLCVQAGIKKYFPITAALLFLPFSQDYAYIILYGLYYIPHVAISFTTIALILQIDHTKENKKKGILFGILFALSIAAGLGGPRQIMICYLPLLLVFILRNVADKKTKWIGVLIAFLGGGIGYVINTKVLHENYRFNTWSDLEITGFSFEKAGSLIMGFFHEYGFTEGDLFSGGLVKSTAAFVILGSIALYFVSYLSRKDKSTAEEHFLAMTFPAMVLLHFMLYLFTNMFYEDRYVLPYIVFAAPLAGFALKHCAQTRTEDAKNWQKTVWTYLIPAAGIAAVFAGGLCRYPGLLKRDDASALKAVADQLVAQGYQSGYASYWNGNIMTELSEGQFEMFNWDDYVSEKIDVEELYVWLQPVSHETKKPDGKVFILLSTQEETECPLVRYLSAEDEAARNAEYVAYGFADYQAMLASLSDFHYDLNDGAWLTGGTAENGAWIMPIGAYATGPNMTFYAGTYAIDVKGQGLERLNYDVTAGFGEALVPSEVSLMESDHMVITVTVPENTYHVEFRPVNVTNENVVISDISIGRQ